MRKPVLFTVVGYLIYAVLAWFIGTLLGLEGRQLWLLRGSLWGLGLIAALAILWYFYSQHKARVAEESASLGELPEDLAVLVREAESKLAAAGLGKIGKLPLVFLAGQPGSAKTSNMLHSGLEPELLSGHVYQDSSVIPTKQANVWLGGRIVFAEAGGPLLADASQWKSFVRRLGPSRAGAVVGSSGIAPRATLLCFDVETFTRPGAADQAAAMGRNLRARLGEMAQELGANLPVYVLFTRADRIPFFMEYVRNLSHEEAAQVLGVSLPMAPDSPAGVYAERESARINEAFEALFRSLCDARPDFLAREHEASQLPAIYEFPREFRKLQTAVTQFLTDLCRPSQLAVGPFLRGFYFSGVRPVVITEAAPAIVRSEPQPAQSLAREATGYFRAGGQAPQAPAAAPATTSRKVPQWVFVPNLFHRVLLQDRVAMGASGSSTKASTLRRVLLLTAAAIALILATGCTVSYFNNRALLTGIRQAADGITRNDGGPVDLASVESLRRLESLRQSLDTLEQYNRDGAPWSYRWGLYLGNDIYPDVRSIYFDRFRQLLLGQTQNACADDLRRLPLTPGPEYSPTYNTLKAYLITTSNHDKSTREFLSPALLARWTAGRDPGSERTQLAQKQFNFYSDELKIANPFSKVNDGDAVDKARRYLAQFGGTERVYQAMLADAAKAGAAINFNRKFPGSSETVLDAYEVAAPFTKPGWDFVKTALNNPDRYFTGEAWVLGDQGATNIDRAQLAQQLRTRYYADFLAQWRAYMKAAAVTRYRDLKDASKKLNVLSGNQSPLLALFWLASQNTAIDAPDLAQAFQPVQTVVPPASIDRYIGPANQNYVNALVTLQASIESVANQPSPDPAAAQTTLANATAAKIAARQLAQAFRIDPDAHVEAIVQKLMEDPITNAEALLRGLGPAELNGKGRGLCAVMRPLFNKYPFSSGATTQATAAEVNAIFRRPDGALWAFYDANLQKYLVKQGAQYVPAPSSGVTITSGFVQFFNQAAAISDALYAGNAQDPHFNYRLRPLPPEGLKNMTVRLTLDGQALTYSGGTASPQQFAWQAGGAHGVNGTLRFGGGPDIEWSNADGLWAVFHFFDRADRWQPLEWIIRSGKDSTPMRVGGQPVSVRFELDMAGAPPLFQKGFFARAACVSEVAR